MTPFIPALILAIAGAGIFVVYWRRAWSISLGGRGIAVIWAAGVLFGAILVCFYASGLVAAEGGLP